MAEEKITGKMENKKSTVKYMKEKYTVSEEAKSRSKKFIKLKKTILNTLKSGNKSIPQISKETDLSLGIVTYYLMTLRRYGFIAETGETTDDDYHLYKLQKIK